MNSSIKHISLILTVMTISILLIINCGGDSSNNPTSPAAEITVTISPTTVTLEPGGTQQFSVTISGTEDTAVTWIVENDIGTITQNGLYTAPVMISGQSVTATVKVISNADATKEGTSTVTIAKPPVELSTIAQDGYNAPQYMKSTGEEALALGAEAVWQASLINGGQTLITTGTLTQTAVNSDNFTYSASPNDKLVVKFANGTTVSFLVTKMDGDFSSNSENFIQQPHEFQITMQISDGTDIEIYSYQNNGQKLGSLKGAVVYENKTWQVDIDLQGSYSFDVGSGSSYENEEQISGTLSSTDFSMTMNEYYHYQSIYVDNFVENVERRSNSTWVQNNTTYALKDVVIRKAFFNSKPSELDSYWIVQGSLLENNVQIGQIIAGTETGYLKIWMQLADENVLLEQYLLN